MKKKLPTFEFIIDDSDESGVKAISIVDDPAFESSLVAFEKAKPKFVQFADKKGKKKKQICAGLSLIPNVLIYRIDEVFGEYYGYFTAETIEKIVEKYHEELNNNKVNIDHDTSKYIDAFMVSDYIVDSEEKVQDLKRMGIEHQNIMGSWFTAFKIKDEQVFDEILNGSTNTGFSVEAYLDTFLVQMTKQINNKYIKHEMKKNNKSLLDKIVDLFKKEIMERSLVPELGFEIEGGQVGEPVQQVTVDENGNETLTPLGVGEFKTDAGIVVVDESSNLVEVKELPVEPEPEPEPEDEIPNLVLPAEESPDEIATGQTENPAEMKSEVVLPTEDVLPPSTEQLDKTILEIVGANDGDYMIKVKVEGGLVTQAEVSSETDLLKAKLSKFEEQTKALETENKELKDKMKEPINEPVLEAPVEKKDWAKMSAYEKALYKSRQQK
jgi:hypothetical protein